MKINNQVFQYLITALKHWGSSEQVHLFSPFKYLYTLWEWYVFSTYLVSALFHRNLHCNHLCTCQK